MADDADVLVIIQMKPTLVLARIFFFVCRRRSSIFLVSREPTERKKIIFLLHSSRQSPSVDMSQKNRTICMTYDAANMSHSLQCKTKEILIE